MTKSKRVSAIVRGPQSHFSKTGVLHPPGSLVPFNPEDPENTGVPAEEVSNDDFRTIKVQCRDRGERWEEERKVRVQFRPVSEDSDAEAPEPSKVGADGKFNAGQFLSATVQDIAAKAADGSVDDF